MTGAKCEAKGKEKRKKYLTRFVGINTAELCCPSYGRSGSRSEEAVTLQKRITSALASVDSTTPYSLVAARVSQVISVALQRAVAYNAPPGPRFPLHQAGAEPGRRGGGQCQ